MHSAWRGVPGARSGNGHVPEFGFSDASCTDGVTNTGCLNCLPNSACRFRLVTEPSWHCKQVFSSTILSRRCPTCGACGLWQLSHAFAATPVYPVCAPRLMVYFASSTGSCGFWCADPVHPVLLWQVMHSAEPLLTFTRNLPITASRFSLCGS